MKGPASPSERTSLVPDALLDLEASFLVDQMKCSYPGSLKSSKSWMTMT
jgi:hypothetical protein